MTTINQKLGIRPRGPRAMMKLPIDRALRNRLTAARCPSCKRTGARLSQLHAGAFVCSWCAHAWDPAPAPEGGAV